MYDFIMAIQMMFIHELHVIYQQCTKYYKDKLKLQYSQLFNK